MPLLAELNQQSRNPAVNPVVINAGSFTPKLGWKFTNYISYLGWQAINYVVQLGWRLSNYTIQYYSMNPIYITLTAGDFGFSWGFALLDAAGAIVNLAAATSLKFQAQLSSDPTVNFSNSMTIVSASAGTCSYTVQQTDFPVAGVYNAQIAVYAGNIEIFHFSSITITANAQV